MSKLIYVVIVTGWILCWMSRKVFRCFPGNIESVTIQMTANDCTNWKWVLGSRIVRDPTDIAFCWNNEEFSLTCRDQYFFSIPWTVNFICFRIHFSGYQALSHSDPNDHLWIWRIISLGKRDDLICIITIILYPLQARRFLSDISGDKVGILFQGDTWSLA